MAREFRLPISVVGPADVARLKRDLEAFDDQLHQAALRAKSGSPVTVGHPGRVFGELADLNGCDLQQPNGRQELLSGLETLQASAPVITMSFAADPSAVFISKIVEWLRANIHPQLLVRVGLQPSIAAGCTIRTTSALYDFSLRSKFAEQRPVLIRRIRETTAKEVTTKAPSKEAPA